MPGRPHMQFGRFTMQGYVKGDGRPHKSWRTHGCDLIDLVEHAEAATKRRREYLGSVEATRQARKESLAIMQSDSGEEED